MTASRILSIDTTTDFGGLALIVGEEVIDEILLHSPDGFGHILYLRLERLLARHGWKVSDVDCFAAASGPGSFTGIRVGLAAAKGLAEALGKPMAAVSNLQAVAWFGSAPLRAVVLDARRGEVYAAVYSDSLEAVLPEVVMRFPAWLTTLPEGDLEFLSTDFAPFRPALEGTRFQSVPTREAPRALAGAVGRLAAQQLRQGLTQDPAEMDANYVRRSDAERFWRD